MSGNRQVSTAEGTICHQSPVQARGKLSVLANTAHAMEKQVAFRRHDKTQKLSIHTV